MTTTPSSILAELGSGTTTIEDKVKMVVQEVLMAAGRSRNKRRTTTIMLKTISSSSQIETKDLSVHMKTFCMIQGEITASDI
mmetsp:Transcript_6498/g.8806  ORF Transcript_6498/g.8806 Transcript_6498/m.8806 type:complete len:82 (-) Transcript_6498:1313-1558(-)